MKIVHLLVEQGPDKGKQITVLPEGARLGRSSKNDIILVDPLLSRHHCRLFLKTGDGLWITDLGSSNQTFVNGKPIQECPLRTGDSVMVGDTVLKVMADERSLPAPQVKNEELQAPAVKPAEEVPAPAVKPIVDLGLAAEKPAPQHRKIGLRALITSVVLVSLLALLAWWPKLFPSKSSVKDIPADVAPEPDISLEIDYEKVNAGPENIFRYRLILLKDRTISIQIDDIAHNRHVATQEKTVDSDIIRDIARFILASGFFDLNEEYRGMQPDILESWDLAVTIGAKTHRTKVVNRVEPEIFNDVRERVEVFGKNELGLWAIQFSTDKLLEMAESAFLQGKKLHDEREIKYVNLADAVKSFQEAALYLETVEPKPEFYAEILANITDCEQEIQKKYDDLNFSAERAIRLRDWEKAASELQILCELIPERSDPRNREARKKLLDVQNRLRSKE